MSKPPELRALLAVGRYVHSAGLVTEVATLVQGNARLGRRLIECLFDDDPGVAQRAADVVERISRRPTPALAAILAASKAAILGLMPDAVLKKLRWNLALTVGRLPLNSAEAARTAELLKRWLDDDSSIVKTAALQGLADLTLHDAAMLPAVLDLLRIHGRSGTAAMRARSRLLLDRLAKQGNLERDTGKSR